MSLPSSLASRLRLPLIAAPMLRVSGPDLVAAACRSGVIGAFPTVNARGAEQLDAWLTRIKARCAEAPGPVAPVCPNIIMRRQTTLDEDLQVLIRHRVEMVIASVGSPEAVIQPLHDIGCLVFADVASIRHAEKALAAGADGLILLTAGAGGQTGWANPFSFVRAVRKMFDGPIVLSGGMSDGAALWAARTLGCDLGMMGTRFIATPESLGADRYKSMLVDSRLDDVLLTQAFTGLDTNMLRPSIVAAGLDPQALQGKVSPERARELFSEHGREAHGPKRWVDIWSAGHSVSGVDRVLPVDELVDVLAGEYARARTQTAKLMQH
ncbi:NAD(P)H-dependent flavin oxidoreductase [Cupriavidus oxalaticus]|uniref:Nitronate monooxygenase n=1 Tax=Cupriavidus oxalaticus TaxID=96344 RepID=A0A375FN08_9BURK|nr:nitronate monooxygenase [Cupriavidus oxalaticus]QRQ84242.1 nitronate monooxygenase [Cupriavidus oxalaticus]QRQ91671.1 nitronate monooxygenase [Cupriavidus oxalaticus]WQD86253.1 nitronate monooxygenase [Cupriavidus oxalaticus]SPC05172.1 Uroporphyrin-III C-methyltransferase/precorrin-2 dehydrogenase/sirohydrochlorin ferrochelatase [Cupriavidus oxalaticus]SPC18034.1 Uroporphyrin-III C-methyltransferase/precorrin-2 dehydrogenase/sirohydrochlorin ferrochelatase [Cupriavidus oxalaticus]